MTAALSWATFAARLLPLALELVRDLYERHHGDLAAARTELRAIRDHWARVPAAEAAVDARLEAVKKREGPP